MLNMLLAVIYLSFVSLGLPDGLLGAGWPTMYQQLNIPVSYAGILSMLISLCTVISSLQSERLTLKLGAGKLTTFSVALTAAALIGFSISRSFWVLCLFAVPYGLGAGSVDASLNNYVALHYSSSHMSWLHCMWGVGATVGPALMGAAIAGGHGWFAGYRWVGFIQIALTLLLFLSLPMWKPPVEDVDERSEPAKPMPLKQVVTVPGVTAVMVTFFCYCAVESSVGLWASSYLVLARGIDATVAARFASLVYFGIMVGRAFCGFIANRFADAVMVRGGQALLGVGVLAVLLPFGEPVALCGLVVIGLGCAPIYPSIIHATPTYFGKERSQALIGVQMASAYVGSLLMPTVYGWMASLLSPALLPWYLLGLLVMMMLMHERLLRIVQK